MSNKMHVVSVTGIVIKDGKYLITQRAPHKKAFPNKWTVPGGNLELSDYQTLPKDTGEHWYNVLEKTLRREITEEVGLEVGKISYLTSLSFVRSDGVPILILSLYAPYQSGEVTLDKESVAFAWVSLEEAKQYDLIEGIYEELEMLDTLLKGGKVGEWKK